MSKYNKDSLAIINLSNYVKPEIKEVSGRKWVLNGDKNSFFQYIIDRYNGSPTNKIIIDTFCKLYYGKGITINGQKEIYKELNDIFSKQDQKKCLNDLKTFGQYDMQILRAKGGGIAKIMHIPTNKLAPEKANDKGEIEAYYYCEDWTNPYHYGTERIPSFKIYNGNPKDALSIKSVRPYSAGKFYFSDPDYLPTLQYAELEEEISNFFINHIQNGLSFGYIVNMNNGGDLTDEEKNQLERKIKQHLTGSLNAGKFIISFNDSKEAEVTIVPLEVNDAHNQWEFLVGEARQQLITGHGAFPNLFGIATANGLSSNADELDVQSRMLQDYQVKPKQDLFIDELAPILELNGLETDLVFIPLRDTYNSTENVEETKVTDETVEDEDNEDKVIEMSEDVNIDLKALISKGEQINYDEWDLIDDRRCDEPTLNERQLNTVFEFASVPSGDSRKTSEQDTSLFKIRYKYAGNPFPEREFCKKMMLSNKVFRAEDLQNAGAVNPGFGVGGANTYNVFLYKGGVNCKHFFQRVIYLKKGNKRIGVNQARKLILQLEPEDRKDAKWEQNPKEVAQIASPSNNHWKVN